jgi:HD-GYP domain-containing protein (c-di-GMP phosphodiesterase class II)
MFEEHNDLASISIEYLYDGLSLPDDIYNYNGTTLLVKKGSVLNETLIKQLKRFNNSEKNIKVSAKMHFELLNRGTPQKYKQQFLEEQVGYTEITNSTRNMIKITEITNQIPYKQVRDIGELLLDRLAVTEPALLVQCINGTNEIDEYLYRHSVNVAIINGLMGKWLQLGEEDINELVILGILHDIGKTRVPQDILNSAKTLSPQEFEIIKKHSEFSDELIKRNKGFHEHISAAARAHHEKMNGTGYPDGLVADDIPLFARITAISDIYDAMVSRRSYKEAQSPFTVLMQMKNEQFSGLDIRLVNLFCEEMPRELVGKSVLMSNGMTGVVRFVNDRNIEYPIVEINGDIILTNRDLYCVSMIIDEV